MLNDGDWLILSILDIEGDVEQVCVTISGY